MGYFSGLSLALLSIAKISSLFLAFYMNGWWATTATTSIFIAAAVTDWLDGYVARKVGTLYFQSYFGC